ncbi:MAG: hypothetical protein AAF581_07295 [Planctomycetota bacterium]
MEQTAEKVVNEQRMVEVVSGLMDTIREAAREEAKLAGNAILAKIEEQLPAPGSGGGGDGQDVVQALSERASELFQSQNWRKELNSVIEGAFQTVLPQLVKRFRKEIEEQMSKLPAPAASADGEAVAAAPTDVNAVIASTEMKEMIDEKFRHMLMYLKTEVIPKAVRMANDSPTESASGSE